MLCFFWVLLAKVVFCFEQQMELVNNAAMMQKASYQLVVLLELQIDIIQNFIFGFINFMMSFHGCYAVHLHLI